MVAQRALGVRAHDADRGDEDAERAGAVVAVERGDVEVDAVGAADRERVRQLHRDEHLPPAAQRPGGVEDRARLVGQQVQELGVVLVLQRGVATTDDAERFGLAGERVGAHRGEAGDLDRGDAALADLGGGERQLANVPAAQVAEPHGLLGGERAVANGGAQAVPGVLAGEDGCCLRAVGLDLV